MLKNFTFSVCPVSIYPSCHTRLAVEAEKISSGREPILKSVFKGRRVERENQF